MIAVIGGLTRIEGAWLGAVAVLVIDNQVTNRIPSDGLPVIGGSFNTVIGVIFLLIVVVSPDGLLGIWDRLWRLGEHEPRPRRAGGGIEPGCRRPGRSVANFVIGLDVVSSTAGVR